ncbi:MAG: 4Fe-4S binding protein [Clostridia bacterium]|nr:4Fe-4S binding protein [Clostridia bacterium]
MFSEDEKLYHSVTLDKDKCKGCTACLKRCPTEAIRIRDGKATITKERCIDCGECIKVCPYHAKKAVMDTFDLLRNFKYNIAVPAPAFYGQFNNLKDIDYILSGLLEIGFDEVYETAKATEAVTDYTRKLLEEGKLEKPIINSACPAVLRLITVRFPSLISHVLPIIAPVEAAAIAARRSAAEKTGLEPSDIGVFFISPCAAKATTVHNPLGLKKSPISAVLSIKDVYMRLLPVLGKLKEVKKLSTSSLEGISWARCGGEIKALGTGRCLSVDGIDNIISLFEAIEDDETLGIDFIEALSCDGGCVSGPLTVENGFVAKMRVVDIAKVQGEKKLPKTPVNIKESELKWNEPLLYRNVLNLDDDISVAMQKLGRIEEIYSELPQIDCGSCGAPTCKCLAEDIVRGVSSETDCIYKMREQFLKLTKDE